jgi:hypothetical protein
MDANFSKLAVEIVLSKQFRYRRGREDAPAIQTASARVANNTSKEGGK